MPKYLTEVEIDYDYPSAKELANRLAKDYGIVTYHGTPHVDFVRAFLDLDLKINRKPVYMSTDLPRVYVYQNSDELLDFAEDVLPLLEDYQGLSITLKGVNSKGRAKHFRIYYKDTLKHYRNKVLNVTELHNFDYDARQKKAA